MTTVAKFATVQTEGDRPVSREIEFYNLDVIIAEPSQVEKDFEAAVKKLKKLPAPSPKKKKP